jgi:hypothetical protein
MRTGHHIVKHAAPAQLFNKINRHFLCYFLFQKNRRAKVNVISFKTLQSVDVLKICKTYYFKSAYFSIIKRFSCTQSSTHYDHAAVTNFVFSALIDNILHGFRTNNLLQPDGY